MHWRKDLPYALLRDLLGLSLRRRPQRRIEPDPLDPAEEPVVAAAFFKTKSHKFYAIYSSDSLVFFDTNPSSISPVVSLVVQYSPRNDLGGLRVIFNKAVPS